MQVFVPDTDVARIAQVLDQPRLNKQLVEADQILRVMLETTIGPDGLCYPRQPKGWRNHPAVLAWRESPEALVRYCMVLENERHARGYARPHKSLANMHTLMQYSGLNYRMGYMPAWWGREEIHLSHRSNLIRKFPEHYRPLWPDVPDNMEYVWPMPKTE